MNPSRENLVDALVAAIRDSLIEGQRIEVPGLGVFSVRHVPSRIEVAEDDVHMMLPPRDEAIFEAAQDGS